MAADRYEYALTLIRTHRYEEAEKELIEYLDKNIEDYEAWNKLGVVRVYLERPDSAQACFQQAIKINDTFAPGYSNLGNLIIKDGDVDKAIQLYEKSIQFDPEYSTAYHNLGVAYRKKGDIAKAVQLLKKSARMSNKNNSSLPGTFQKDANKKVQWILVLCIACWILFFIWIKR